MVNQQQEAKDGIAWLEKYIAQLEQERDYLDARLAEFERLATRFVNFKAPDHVCRMEFRHLLNGGKLEE
jgi:hypothetical protein